MTESPQDDIHMIAKEAGREGAKIALAEIGVDIDDHKSVREFQDNLEYVQNMREFNKIVGRKITTTFVGALVIAVLYVIWQGIRHYLPGN